MTIAPVAIDCASFVESMARLTKLLVANRGEIALRIIRSARLFGLKTVAVYSAADANSAHVGAADEAIAIGPAEAAKSYLNIAAIIAAAKQSGADAIHPGYGFLSERPEFAQAAADAQIVFVGPPNAGKSRLLTRLTRATPEVAAYPFTTREPHAGMMDWEDVRVQLLDMPPITPDFLESYVTSMARSADACALFVDLGDDDGPFATEAVLDKLAQVKTVLTGNEPADPEDLTIEYVKTLLLANKLDAPGAGDRLEIVREMFGDLVRKMDGERGLADSSGPIDGRNHHRAAQPSRLGGQPGERLERVGPADEMPCRGGQLPRHHWLLCRSRAARGRRAGRARRRWAEARRRDAR